MYYAKLPLNMRCIYSTNALEVSVRRCYTRLTVKVAECDQDLNTSVTLNCNGMVKRLIERLWARALDPAQHAMPFLRGLTVGVCKPQFAKWIQRTCPRLDQRH